MNIDTGEIRELTREQMDQITADRLSRWVELTPKEKKRLERVKPARRSGILMKWMRGHKQ